MWWGRSSTKDGRFTLAKLKEFVVLCAERAKLYKPHEFFAQVHAHCTLCLWLSVSGGGTKGRASFQEWFTQLLRENSSPEVPTEDSPKGPGGDFLGRDTIKTLHRVLNVQSTHGLDFQAFFDLLQRAGEERDLMNPEDEALDEFVPAVVVHDFAGTFIRGFSRVMEQSGGFHNIPTLFPTGEGSTHSRPFAEEGGKLAVSES